VEVYLRATAAAGILAIGVAAAILAAVPAGGQGRNPRVELLDAGDLGGDPRSPALAGGLWASEPLVLGVEPDLDRTVLYRLPGPGAGPAALPQPVREMGATGDAEATADIVLAGGRATELPAPALPAVLPFPPLPPAVSELRLASNGRAGVAAWVAQEGSEIAPLRRVSVRRITPDGRPIGDDITLQAGPALPRDLAVAMNHEGDVLVAWTNHLQGRGAGLRWRAIDSAGELGPLRNEWDVPSDIGSPSIVPAPTGGGFLVAYLSTSVGLADPATSPHGPPREIRLMRVARGDMTHAGSILVRKGPGLDNPTVVARDGASFVFWTDPRGGGRALKMRLQGIPNGGEWPDTALRTDLRLSEPVPYRVVAAPDGLWLVTWPQSEGRGRAMVLEARLFTHTGYAAGPPLLLARSAGDIALRDLIEAKGADRWIALWTEEEAGRYRLRYRQFRREPGK
jgi:hypothetical protein